MDRVLVTGGAGFIGLRVVQKLVAQGHSVTVLDNLERQVHGGLEEPDLGGSVRFILGDVRKRAAWRTALREVEGVIHLAAMTGSAQSFWEASKYFDVNAGGTAILAELLTRGDPATRGIQKIVVASSSYVYGEGAYHCPRDGAISPPVRPLAQLKQARWEVPCQVCQGPATPVPATEAKTVQVPNPYAITKYATERTILVSAEAQGLPAVALRYFNVFGPGQSLRNPYTGVMTVFANHLIHGMAPVIYEDGNMQRDFVYIDDVVDATVRSLSKGQGVYNIGSGKPTTIWKLAELLRKEMGSGPEATISGEYRPGDIRCLFADTRKTEAELSFRPRTDLETGVEMLVDWVRGHPPVILSDVAEEERRKYLGGQSTDQRTTPNTLRYVVR